MYEVVPYLKVQSILMCKKENFVPLSANQKHKYILPPLPHTLSLEIGFNLFGIFHFFLEGYYICLCCLTGKCCREVKFCVANWPY